MKQVEAFLLYAYEGVTHLLVVFGTVTGNTKLRSEKKKSFLFFIIQRHSHIKYGPDYSVPAICGYI